MKFASSGKSKTHSMRTKEIIEKLGKNAHLRYLQENKGCWAIFEHQPAPEGVTGAQWVQRSSGNTPQEAWEDYAKHYTTFYDEKNATVRIDVWSENSISITSNYYSIETSSDVWRSLSDDKKDEVIRDYVIDRSSISITWQEETDLTSRFFSLEEIIEKLSDFKCYINCESGKWIVRSPNWFTLAQGDSPMEAWLKYAKRHESTGVLFIRVSFGGIYQVYTINVAYFDWGERSKSEQWQIVRDHVLEKIGSRITWQEVQRKSLKEKDNE